MVLIEYDEKTGFERKIMLASFSVMERKKKYNWWVEKKRIGQMISSKNAQHIRKKYPNFSIAAENIET